MRSTTFLGLLLGFSIIYLVIYSDGSIQYFLNWEAFIIVCLGTISSLIVYFTPYALATAFKILFRLFTERQISDENLVQLMVHLSRKARRAGFIDLYQSTRGIGISFLEKGLMLLADGVDGRMIEEILNQESETIYAEHKIAERFFRTGGSFSPLFGILGTVMGLISMLNNIQNPQAIPAAMGMALVTTFYGLLFSALFFKPIAGKIHNKNESEYQKRKIILEAIMAIHKGENSQHVKEKLATFAFN